MMFGLSVRFDLKDEASAKDFDQLVAETSVGIRTREPGTLVYVTHTVQGEPLARVFYEMYRDRQAFEEHGRQPHTLRFLSTRDQYVAQTRVEFLSPVTAKGVGDSA
jgi:quinol monooxygenase YgiN